MHHVLLLLYKYRYFLFAVKLWHQLLVPVLSGTLCILYFRKGLGCLNDMLLKKLILVNPLVIISAICTVTNVT